MSKEDFVEFQEQVEAINAQYEADEISEDERVNQIRNLKYEDEWGDVWMLSPDMTWFRKAKGSKTWIRDYPIKLVDGDDLPPIPEMDMHQISWAVHHCTMCELHETRTRAVPGEGDPNADIMLIGEGPGANEDKQARPFVGASGKFLDELLANIGYSRNDVFIANVVKCRPPGNRDPQQDELDACKPYLDRQIELINPRVIVTLGRYSMYRYFPGASITKIHGQPKRVGNRLVVPMFHPAAALHQPRWRPLIKEDFEKLPDFIKEAEGFEDDDTIDPSSAQQLSMF